MRLIYEKTKSDDVELNVESFVLAALLECASRGDYFTLLSIGIVKSLTAEIVDDLQAFAAKDPAASSDLIFILKTYTSFAAVLHYRIAHWVYLVNGVTERKSVDASLPALLSRRGKLLSGAELHFKSEIGRRFVLDHGYGTVIGETSIIGNDCYILGGVTLGARGICGNPSTARHPIIGNRVQVGTFSSVLGRVRVGDDVFIGSNCIVTQDVPDGMRVTVKSSLQIISRD